MRTKFATQVDEELLQSLRQIAKDEGRQIQSVVEEAFSTLIEQRKQARPRSHVIDAYQKSHERYASLYRKLA